MEDLAIVNSPRQLGHRTMTVTMRLIVQRAL